MAKQRRIVEHSSKPKMKHQQISVLSEAKVEKDERNHHVISTVAQKQKQMRQRCNQSHGKEHNNMNWVEESEWSDLQWTDQVSWVGFNPEESQRFKQKKENDSTPPLPPTQACRGLPRPLPTTKIMKKQKKTGKA